MDYRTSCALGGSCSHPNARFHFDDMHSEGIYSYELLYELGRHKTRNMRAYIKFLQRHNKSRCRPSLRKE
jgi:DUF971 family protein